MGRGFERTEEMRLALAQSQSLDSDRDGTPNYLDSTPVFVSSQIKFGLTLTNTFGKKSRLSWCTIPQATNVVLFKTNLLQPSWSVLTNFVTPPPPIGPATNVIVLDPSVTNNAARFYRISVTPAFP